MTRMTNHLTTKQAALIRGVTRRRINQLIDEGKLQAKKFGDVWMIKEKDVQKKGGKEDVLEKEKRRT